MKEPAVRQARKSGGSIIVSLTDFIKEDKYYVVNELDDGTVTLKELALKREST